MKLIHSTKLYQPNFKYIIQFLFGKKTFIEYNDDIDTSILDETVCIIADIDADINKIYKNSDIIFSNCYIYPIKLKENILLYAANVVYCINYDIKDKRYKVLCQKHRYIDPETETTILRKRLKRIDEIKKILE